MGYRADIQGLRAVCVILVILYHAKLPLFGGGFIGVDVFFVLSGFLITGLILRELQQTATLDVVAFWARRARRLLPNALLVLAVTMGLALALGQGVAGPALPRDLVAASLYFANYHFAARATDYFNHESAQSPVLHYWSLSIEEQYYLVFPVLIWLGARYLAPTLRPRIALFLAVVAAVSFGVGLNWLSRSQPDAFFRTEARIWQIAVGGIVAATFGSLEKIPPIARAAAAWAGLATLLAMTVLVDDTWRYPGLLALLPVTATVALVAGGNAIAAAPGCILGSRPMRLIGDASYSLYLWHFPLMVLGEAAWPEVPHVRLFAIAAAIPLAMLAYRLVELPIRTHAAWHGRPIAQRSTLGLAVLASTAAAASFLVVGRSWLLTDYTTQAARLAAAARQDVANLGRCQLGLKEAQLEPCAFGAPGASRRLVLFGDSYAGHLFDGLQQAATDAGWQMKVRVKLSCPPLDAFAYSAELRAPDTACTQWRQAALAEMLAERPDLVVISTWTNYIRNLHDERTGKPLSSDASQAAWREGFRRVLARITGAGIKVVVVRPTPGARSRVVDCFAAGNLETCNRPRSEATRLGEVAVEVAREFPNVTVIDLTDRFCSANTCYGVVKGMIVYSDNTGHLTATFSRSLAPAFAEILMPWK